MPRAAILAYEGCYISTLGGYADLLQVANSHLTMAQRHPREQYQWEFVSATGGSILTSNGLSVDTCEIGQSGWFDIVFIPSAFYQGKKRFSSLLKKQINIASWLKQQWGKGAFLVSCCTGTFILAETSLLNERIATTTWWLADEFRKRYPKVNLQLDPVITESDRLICAGSSAAYLIQTIHIIKHFSGPTVASQCAKTMLIDTNRTKQLPYLPFLAEREHSDSLVHKAQQQLQKNMRTELRISMLAELLGVSERTLIRRFRLALGQSPLNYLQGLRIDSAQNLLRESDQSIEFIATSVGYTDTSSFCRLFKQKVGDTPGAYRSRFRQ